MDETQYENKADQPEENKESLTIEELNRAIMELRGKAPEGKILNLRRQLRKLEKAKELKKKRDSVNLTQYDAFGNVKPKNGHGALNRHERRKQRKLAKLKGL